MERRDSTRIGDSLLKEGLVSRAQLKEALAIKKKEDSFLGCLLVKKGYLTEEQLAIHAVERYNHPYLPLLHYEINPEAVKMIPEELARKYFTLPLDKIGNLLTLTHAHPLENEKFKELEKVTGCSLTSYISTISEIEAALDRAYKSSKGKEPHQEEKESAAEEGE